MIITERLGRDHAESIQSASLSLFVDIVGGSCSLGNWFTSCRFR